jgi:MYXO-CTERM domain-containing protein
MLRYGRKKIVLAWVAAAAVSLSAASQSAAIVLINELDSDTPGSDTAEFIELHNTDAANAVMTNGLVLTFFNGNGDVSYHSIDLDGHTIPAGGFFVIGNPGVPNVAITFDPGTQGLLQNGQDAVGLYQQADPHPNATAVTATNLLDAVVYDTADADDPGLLDILTPGQPQVDEAGGGPSATFSIGRFPNGAGGARNTMSWGAMVPTPGASNSEIVPEPTCLGLLAVGGLLLMRRRRA